MNPDDIGHKGGVPGRDRGPDAVPKPRACNTCGGQRFKYQDGTLACVLCTPPRAVGHTCPSIDKARKALRRVCYAIVREDYTEATSAANEAGMLFEEIRADNEALRARAAWAEEQVQRLKGGF